MSLSSGGDGSTRQARPTHHDSLIHLSQMHVMQQQQQRRYLSLAQQSAAGFQPQHQQRQSHGARAAFSVEERTNETHDGPVQQHGRTINHSNSSTDSDLSTPAPQSDSQALTHSRAQLKQLFHAISHGQREMSQLYEFLSGIVRQCHLQSRAVKVSIANIHAQQVPDGQHMLLSLEQLSELLDETLDWAAEWKLQQIASYSQKLQTPQKLSSSAVSLLNSPPLQSYFQCQYICSITAYFKALTLFLECKFFQCAKWIIGFFEDTFKEIIQKEDWNEFFEPEEGDLHAQNGSGSESPSSFGAKMSTVTGTGNDFNDTSTAFSPSTSSHASSLARSSMRSTTQSPTTSTAASIRARHSLSPQSPNHHSHGENPFESPFYIEDVDERLSFRILCILFESFLCIPNFDYASATFSHFMDRYAPLMDLSMPKYYIPPTNSGENDFLSIQELQVCSLVFEARLLMCQDQWDLALEKITSASFHEIDSENFEQDGVECTNPLIHTPAFVQFKFVETLLEARRGSLSEAALFRVSGHKEMSLQLTLHSYNDLHADEHNAHSTKQQLQNSKYQMAFDLALDLIQSGQHQSAFKIISDICATHFYHLPILWILLAECLVSSLDGVRSKCAEQLCTTKILTSAEDRALRLKLPIEFTPLIEQKPKTKELLLTADTCLKNAHILLTKSDEKHLLPLTLLKLAFVHFELGAHNTALEYANNVLEMSASLVDETTFFHALVYCVASLTCLKKIDELKRYMEKLKVLERFGFREKQSGGGGAKSTTSNDGSNGKTLSVDGLDGRAKPENSVDQEDKDRLTLILVVSELLSKDFQSAIKHLHELSARNDQNNVYIAGEDDETRHMKERRRSLLLWIHILRIFTLSLQGRDASVYANQSRAFPPAHEKTRDGREA
eukprot:CAMPEP_0117453232 /NCGR_PEP_ID=MMETSP0759-20121206/10100_1 /TAXON_ID=63605 /ORGANISM="Percolomonas cosmopolitus, Strain WS" /LENGTH=897 /DNA_ID=CAMNT_0005246223 /DNA_START=242 /DNA_END=2934 /DNA_ORIENTATION=+